MVIRTTGLEADKWEKDVRATGSPQRLSIASLQKKVIGASYPLGRLVQPIDVAKAIAFLASDVSPSSSFFCVCPVGFIPLPGFLTNFL